MVTNNRWNDKLLKTHTHKVENWGSNSDHGVQLRNFDIFVDWMSIKCDLMNTINC
jgi:hypothetical protein